MSLWNDPRSSQSGGYGIGGGWLDMLKTAVFGGGQQPQPRQVPPMYASPPRPMNPNGTLGNQAGYDPTPQPVTSSGVPQPQEDPLDRFERIARMMEFGERVGGAFDKGPYETISAGGGYARPELPQSAQYGLNVLR
jgi:hypothetical protein